MVDFHWSLNVKDQTKYSDFVSVMRYGCCYYMLSGYGVKSLVCKLIAFSIRPQTFLGCDLN